MTKKIEKQEVNDMISDIGEYFNTTYYDKMSMESVAVLNLFILMLNQKMDEYDES